MLLCNCSSWSLAIVTESFRNPNSHSQKNSIARLFKSSFWLSARYWSGLFCFRKLDIVNLNNSLWPWSHWHSNPEIQITVRSLLPLQTTTVQLLELISTSIFVDNSLLPSQISLSLLLLQTWHFSFQNVSIWSLSFRKWIPLCLIAFCKYVSSCLNHQIVANSCLFCT